MKLTKKKVSPKAKTLRVKAPYASCAVRFGEGNLSFFVIEKKVDNLRRYLKQKFKTITEAVVTFDSGVEKSLEY